MPVSTVHGVDSGPSRIDKKIGAIARLVHWPFIAPEVNGRGVRQRCQASWILCEPMLSAWLVCGSNRVRQARPGVPKQ